jgi:hypothetical protein
MSRLSSFTGKNFENYSDGGGNANPDIKQISFNENLNIIFVPSNQNITEYRVLDFPVYNGFDRKVITFTLVKNQPALPLGPTLPTSLRLLGTDGSNRLIDNSEILWLDGTEPSPENSVTQFINYIVVNTDGNPNGASLTQYTVYGNLNGPYS